MGSAEFAEEFFIKQIEIVRTNVRSLETNVPDLHTRLCMFIQCIIQKIPYLLGVDIMHRLLLDWYVNN